MPRETLADISIGEFPVGKGGLLRVIPDHNTPGLYSLIEVPAGKVLEIQRDLGEAWKDSVWIYGQETSGLTKRMVGEIIASKLPKSESKK